MILQFSNFQIKKRQEVPSSSTIYFLNQIMFKAKIRLFLKLLYTWATVQFSMKLDHKLLGVEIIFFEIFETNKILP